MGSYLGISESLGGAKTQIFGFLQERLHNRVNGWTAKLLSKGGKEVLIKSVATAMPTHVMSCFRLPKAVTKKLTSVIARFWWSTGNNQAGMHWIAWEKLCRDKCDGGLGFRLIKDFNTALLAKQLWRLIDKPESLFAKVFKSRYYRKSDPLDPIRTYSPSYGWRSIVSARSLVNKGLIKRVESGSSISVWNDPWLPAPRPRPATCKFRTYPNMVVNDLIDPSTRSWHLSLIDAVINPHDADIIRQIPLSRIIKPDSVGWHFTKTGKYTVKSGYSIERLYPDSGVVEVSFGPDVKPLLAQAWKVNCPPKLKHFLWQLLSGCVSVSKNLRSRGILCDMQCLRCGAEEESINHVLFECPPAFQTWVLSLVPTNQGVFPGTSVYANMDFLFWRLPQGIRDTYFPWIIWYIWKSRNDFVLANKDRSPQDILALATTEGNIWQEAHTGEEGLGRRIDTHSRIGETVIESEFSGIWWCFVDGAWKASDMYSGQGWYCKRIGEADQIMGIRNIRCSLSPLHTEFEALLWAMECMYTLQRTPLVFATDCSDLVKIVSSPLEWPVFSIHLEEFQYWKERLENFQLKLVARTKNGKADKLARNARSHPSELVYIDSVPLRWLTLDV